MVISKTTLITAINAAAAMNIARQPKWSATTLDTGRASRMPSNRPPMMLPTTRPRDSAGARCAASGIRICTDTELKPISNDTSRNRFGCSGKRRTQQAGDGDHGGADHQLAVFQQVTQGHQEEQAQGVADLRQRYDQAGHGGRQADVRRDQLDDRLRVVDVGDDGAAAERKQHHHPAGHGARSVGSSVHGVLIKAKEDGERE